MRRKSERNKSKGSPEKKVEKPIKKSTRTRRTKRSASSSPEPEPAKQASTSLANNREPPEKGPSVQTRLQSKEVEASAAAAARKTEKSSSESDIKPASAEEDDNNDCSVWKVARADASPGEIQKLTLCRQHYVESDSDPPAAIGLGGKRRSSKWQESGEGLPVEADAVVADDEPLAERNSGASEPASAPQANPGQESSDEVSDRKELLPETTSADFSDDKPNIDQQGESPEANTTSDRSVESEQTKPSNPMPLAPSSNGQFPTALDHPESPTPDQLVEKVNEPSIEPSPENISDDEKAKAPATSSESNDERDEAARTGQLSRATRRKHRNKYRDSSNSETNESEEDSFDKRDVEEKSSPPPQDNVEERKEPASPKTVLTPQDDPPQSNETAKETSQVAQDKSEGETTCQQSNKPAKVNLKRSFSARKLTENEAKTEETDEKSAETAGQNKENCNDAEELKYVPRKRRWGTALSTDMSPSFSVSTDSLKVLVPGAKPLPMNEVRLTKDDDEEKDGYRSGDKWPATNESSESNVKLDEDESPRVSAKKLDGKDNHIAARRKISIVKESSVKSPSPPSNKPTNILLIKNLVRPFTLNQIKELLSRTGTIVENGFWMDRIKSKCFVEYAHEDQAFETRQALHGISWPISNPKKLIVEYASKEDMELARELSKDQPIQRKTEPLVPTDWQQDWNREGKPAATKVTVVREWDLGKEDGQQHVKEKEKKEDKKRRQRSRSPVQEVHLPAPARKFKKKEDEPPPAKLLDDLFRKTKAAPCIYWLPLTNEQIVVKEEMRRQHMAEHARRLEEMRRAERNRDSRRRRSPRK